MTTTKKSTNVTFRATAPDLSLPVRAKSIVYGVSEVGKSPVLAQIPNAYIIDTERGMRHYKKDILANNSVVLESTDVDEIREEILKLQSCNHPYTTLVIDSLSYLYDLASDKWTNTHRRCLQEDMGATTTAWQRVKKKRALELNQLGYDYWRNLNGEMRRLQYLLGSKSDIDMNIIVVAYEHEREVTVQKSTDTQHVSRPHLPKKSEHLYDYTLHLYKPPEARLVPPTNTFTESLCAVTGKGSPLPSFIWNIENLQKYILKSNEQSKPHELATPETIDFILQNKDAYISPVQESRWLAKLDITSWDSLPKEAGEKIIQYIEKKRARKLATSEALQKEDVPL